jgi:hypothetical protein
MKYQIKYFFDYNCNSCLWANDDKTKNKYNYNINLKKLKLDKEILELMNEIQVLKNNYLNPFYQMLPSLWNEDLCIVYNKKVKKLYNMIKKKLNNDFNIINNEKEIHQDKDLNYYIQNPEEYYIKKGIK